MGLLALTQDGKLAGVAVSDQNKQSYFYCAEIGSAPQENQQLSLFDEVQETTEDAALAQAVRRLTARCQVYTLNIKEQYGYYAWEESGENPTENHFAAIIGAYLLNPLKL